MSKRALSLLFLMAVGVGCAPASEHQVMLLDGKPVDAVLRDGIKVNYNGKNTLSIRKDELSYRVNAKVPSVLYSSASGQIALNFGSGSGQVYDLEILDTDSGRLTNFLKFKQRLVMEANRKGCQIRADEISIVFEKWLSGTSYSLKTEDFSRRSGCSMINRDWRLDIPVMSS